MEIKRRKNRKEKRKKEKEKEKRRKGRKGKKGKRKRSEVMEMIVEIRKTENSPIKKSLYQNVLPFSKIYGKFQDQFLL